MNIQILPVGPIFPFTELNGPTNYITLGPLPTAS
jgi:hypothetical protein